MKLKKDGLPGITLLQNICTEMAWIFNKARLKNHQTGYRRLDPDPSVLRRKKIRKRILWAAAGLVFYIVTIASSGRIIFLFEPEISTTHAFSTQLSAFTPGPSIFNAYKLGHGLTQLRYAETDAHQYIKWRNRTVAQLVALGIDVSVIQEAIDDSILTLDETIVLRDQLQAKLKKLHGAKVASAFVVGVELIPATRAFELYLKDNGYRNLLAKSNVSILQLGSLLNANLDAALFPKNLKIDLVAAYAKTYPEDTTQSKLGQIMRFRGEILNYFYGDEEDIRSGELFASSSDRSPNLYENNYRF